MVVLLNRIRAVHSSARSPPTSNRISRSSSRIEKKKSDEVVCSRDSNWQHGAPLAISILIKLPILFSPSPLPSPPPSLLLPPSLEGVTTSSLIANLAVSSKSKRLATYTSMHARDTGEYVHASRNSPFHPCASTLYCYSILLYSHLRLAATACPFLLPRSNRLLRRYSSFLPSLSVFQWRSACLLPSLSSAVSPIVLCPSCILHFATLPRYVR